MKKVTVYTMNYCPYCTAAKKLLESKSLPFEEILVQEDDQATWTRLEKETGFKTMPQIFVGDKFIGGFTDLQALDRNGQLDALLK